MTTWAVHKQGPLEQVKQEVAAAKYVWAADEGAQASFEHAKAASLDLLARFAPSTRNVRVNFGGNGPALNQLIVLSM